MFHQVCLQATLCDRTLVLQELPNPTLPEGSATIFDDRLLVELLFTT